MDLVNSITNLNTAATMSKVQYAVARKMLDNQQMQGDAAIKLLNAAVQNTSSAGDQLVAAATGLGGSVDTYG